MRKLSAIILSLFLYSFVSAQPVITSFSPAFAAVGASVTINGSNFSATPVNNTVYFGAVKANVTAATTNSLTVTVPAGASHKPITVSVNGLTAYSPKPFIVTFSGGALSSASFTYELGLDNVTGIETNDMANGDFDGDGKSDIAVVDRINGFMAVYKNNSTTSVFSFAARINFMAGTQPRAISAGDIDGDSKLDIVVANTNDNSVSVYRNTSTVGTISFAAKIDFTTAVQPLDIALADYDGDGKTDIATANGALLPSFITVLRNTSTIGTVSFAARTDISVIFAGGSIATGDLNNDGKFDLAVVDIAANTLTVLTNNSSPGTISFPTNISFPTGTTPDGIVIGDIDGDNKPDIAYANFFSETLAIHRNTTTGSTISFTQASTSALPGADRVTMDDADGDGKPDVIVQTFSPSGFSILKNNSSPGAITLASAIAYPASCSDGVITGDWNNDGKIDVGLGCGVFRVGIWKNKTTEPQITSFSPTSAGTGATVTITGVNLTGVTSVTFGGVAASSFTVVNSTTITAVVGAGASGTVSVIAPQGTGAKDGFTYLGIPFITSFNPTSGELGAVITITGVNFTGVTAVNFGGVAASSFTVVNPTTITATVANGASGSVSVTNGNGTGSLPGFTYLAPTITSFNPTSIGANGVVTITGTNFLNVSSVSFGGTPALSFNVVNSTTITAVVGGGSSGSVSVTTLSGTAQLGGFSFSSPPPPIITSFTPATGLVASSVVINGNNFNTTPANNIVYFGATKATVNSATSNQLNVSVPAGSTYFPICVLNSSNNLAGASATPFIATFPNGGVINNGVFSDRTDINIGVSTGPIDAEISDLDGDGKPDIIFSRINNSIGYCRNISSPGGFIFSPIEYINGFNTNSQRVNIADIDGDGKPDVIGVTASGALAVARNTSTPGTISFAAAVTIFSNNIGGQKIGIADLNDDGKPEIVVPTGGNFLMSVLRNTSLPGIFSFAAPLNFTTLGAGADAALADFDGDGKRDIVISNGFINSSISVFRNTTAGSVLSFASRIDFTTGANPGAVATCDIDNDNKIDVLVANTNSNFYSIFKNNGTSGSISFAARVDQALTTPGFILDIITADVDGDGKPDVLTATDLTNTGAVSIFKNNSTPGTITLGAQVNCSSGIPWSAAVADMDGDNRPDIVAAYPNWNFVSILKNNITNLPVINFFTPLNGTQGDLVSITGENFNGATGISFGGVAAQSFTVVSNTAITAIVATGATGSVAVTTPAGTGTKPGFIYHQPPTITSFTPTTGTVGTTITITGTNLSGTTAVRFGGVNASSFNIVNSTTVTAVVGNGASGNVSVTTFGGQAVLSGFTFIAPAPTVFSFTPTNGTTGTSVTINGSFFTGATAVSFGGVAASSFTVNNSSSITAIVGNGATGAVSVTTPAGTGSLMIFNYSPPPPLISSFSPTSGTTGTTITITGNNFTGATAVSFGSIPAASFTVVNATTITAVVGNGGSGVVTVQGPGGVSNLAGFVYLPPPPTITSFNPTTAGAGATVTITGTNFTGTTAVNFGGVAATSFTVVNATTITAVVSSGASGNINVTTSGGTTSLAGFTFIPAPAITSFTPLAATTGATVTITGTNFTGTTAVSFGGVAATSFTVVNSTTITAVVGNGATGNIIVTTPGGTTSLAGFTFTPVTGIFGPVYNNTNELLMAPNPVDDIAIIKHPSSNKNAKLRFVDMTGRDAFVIIPVRNTKNTQVSIKKLPGGIYYLIWSDGGRTLSRTVVKE